MLTGDHEAGHHLTDSDEQATENGRLLRREVAKKDAWDDSKESKRVKHEIKPVENVVVDLVLLFDEAEVASRGRERR